MRISPNLRRHLRIATPFVLGVGSSFAFIAYLAKVRNQIREDRQADQNFDHLADVLKLQTTKPLSIEEIYQKEIVGKTFDNWKNIRGPHIGEDNSEYFKLLAKQTLRLTDVDDKDLTPEQKKLLKEAEEKALNQQASIY